MTTLTETEWLTTDERLAHERHHFADVSRFPDCRICARERSLMFVHRDREGRPMAETALCGVHEFDEQAYAEMKDQRLNVHDWDGRPRVTVDGEDDPITGEPLACTVCGYRQGTGVPA